MKSTLLTYLIVLLCPAGIYAQNPDLHYRADAGTNTSTNGGSVTSWNDQAGSINATSTGTAPTYTSVLANYNPAIDFTNTGSFLIASDNAINGSNANSKSYAIVFKTSADVTSTQVILDNGDYQYGLALYIQSGNLYGNYYNKGFNFPASSTITANTLYIFTFIIDDGNSRWDGYLNGYPVMSNTGVNKSFRGHSEQSSLGDLNGAIQDHNSNDITTSSPFSGSIMEFVYYDDVTLKAIERKAVESSLAFKYGMQLNTDFDGDGNLNEAIAGSVREADYVDSDGSNRIWTYSSQGAAYYNQVAGIGRDDGFPIYQKQSRSGTNGMVAMGLGDIYASNANNPNTVGDNRQLMWGNNGGGLTFSQTGAAPFTKIIGRTWRVQERGNTGTVKVQVPANTSSMPEKIPSTPDLMILVDGNGDFSSGATVIPMTLNGTNWEADVDFSSGDYFTFAQEYIIETYFNTTVNGNENGTVSIEFTVSLVPGNTTGSAVTFDVDDLGTGYANDGSDYQSIPGSQTITIADGANSATYSVVVYDDSDNEGVEDVIVGISNPSNNAFLLNKSTDTATIYDDEVVAPGGVSSNLNVWLRTDMGTSTTNDNDPVTYWRNVGGLYNHATSDGDPPKFITGEFLSFNFQPYLDFDGGNDRMVIDLDAIKNSDYTIMAVGRRNDPNVNIVLGSPGGVTGQSLAFGHTNGTTATLNYGSNNLSLGVSGYNSPESPYLLVGSQNTTGRYLEELRDNVLLTASDGNTTYLQGSGTNYIGDLQSTGNFDGALSEIIVYDKFITPFERQKIYSYIGVKYGMTLPDDNDDDGTANEVVSGAVREGDYVASDGTVIWDYAANGAEFFNDITGIGKDQVSGLNQKQSYSVSYLQDLGVAIGLETYELNNNDNPAEFSADKTFMMFGNNDGAITFSTDGAPATRKILGRTWKVQVTGTIDSVVMVVPGAGSGIPITLPGTTQLDVLIDADGDFSSGARVIPMYNFYGLWFGTVDVADGEYFTFARYRGTELEITTNGNEIGPKDLVYTVNLNRINSSGSTVTFDIDDAGTGSAIAGTDYVAIPGSAKISVLPGSMTGTYTVTVLDDALGDGPKTLDLQISNPSNSDYFLESGSDVATGTMWDDELLSPGEISGQLVFWFKADSGTNTTTDGGAITSWADQGQLGNNAGVSGTNPTFTSVLANYNPALYFNGNGGITIPNSADINTATSTQKSFSIVFRTGVDVVTCQLLYEEGGGTHGLNLYIENGRVYNNLWVSNADNAASATIEPNTDYILTFIYDGASGRWDSYINGVLAFSDASAPASLPTHSGAIGIGEINNATQYDGGVDVSAGDGFMGHIMEMAYYNAKALSATERQQIETYLAIKYAISLPVDYLAPDGTTTLWDATANSIYGNLVTGIGHQMMELLFQRQSGSELSGRAVSIGLDAIATDNALNPNDFAVNQSYLIWGSNGDSLTFSSSGAPYGSMILARKYKVQKTGTVDSVTIQVPANSTGELVNLSNLKSLNLLIDTDGDFRSGATVLPMSKVGNKWEAKVEFNDGDHFSFAIPGGILATRAHGDEDGLVDIVFELSLAGPNTSGSPLYFDIFLLGSGTATSGDDFIAFPSTPRFVIPNGDSVATFTVGIIDDYFIESTETIQIAVDSTSNPLYSLSSYKATALIYDDDSPLPGGIDVDPTFWLRADDSTSTTSDGNPVSDWYDKSTNGHDASATGTGPLFDAVGANYNPAIEFTATSGGFVIADALDININSGGYSAKTYAVAFRTSGDITTLQVVYEQGGTGNGLNLYIENGFLKANWWAGATEISGSIGVSANVVYVCTFIYDGASGQWNMYLNGELAATGLSVPSNLPSHSDDNGLGDIQGGTQFDGARDINGSQPFFGDIMEMFYYDEIVLTPSERNRLETYLSVKYGAPYQAGLLSGDGTTVVWDSAADYTHNNNLTAISRDTKNGLNQKQSYSNAREGILSIGLSSIAADNASNAASFATGFDYLVWGNNGDTLGSVVSNGDLIAQSGIVDRLQRIWKIRETGTVDSVRLAFPKDSIDQYLSGISGGNLCLLMADDAALSVNTTYNSLSVTTINGVASYITDYDFSGTKYFTIARRDIILWTGKEWRGGLSVTTPHGPSDDPDDQIKDMYIWAGDTAAIAEGVIVSGTTIDSAAVLRVKPASCLTVSAISNNGDFILQADSTGFGQYKGPAVLATFQQYIDDYGWHLIGSPFSDATWADLTFVDGNGFVNHPLSGASMDSCIYCNLWWYDTSTDNGSNIGFGTSDAFGTWRSSVDSNESFAPDKGWNLFLDEDHFFAGAPWTISMTGTFNNGNISQQVNENNAGWNLVANPYPSALDWDTVDNDLAAAGIAGGYHIWDHENTNYAVYAGGIGTLGLTRYIAPFQGFYVQTSTVGAQGSGDVLHSFDLENMDRPDVCPSGLGNFYKSGGFKSIVLKSRHLGSGKIDETIIRLSETSSREFESEDDIRKLFTPYEDVPSIFTKTAAVRTAITSMLPPSGHDSVFVGSRAAHGSQISIEAIDAPAGYTVYLEDVKTGKWYRIDREPYIFTQDESFRERFWLHFSPNSLSAQTWDANSPFSIYMAGDMLMVETRKNVTNGSWYLTSVNGAVVRRGMIQEGSGHVFQINTANMARGAYIFVLESNNRNYAEKVVKY